MGIDHVGLAVPKDKFDECVKFYLAALGPLGYKEMMRPIPTAVGLGSTTPHFWLSACDVPKFEHVDHIAFSADNHEDIQKCYEAGMAAGGVDNGKPGLRAHYHPNYYAAFMKDPCGHNLEIVCHVPQNESK